ncbi:MAG: hypothetical protein IJS32_04220 [Kiritimatiellae bacterium]|nr:hypothetical protein [Kiritimatiellia bacterium]
MNRIAKFAVLLLLPLAARGAPVMPYGTYLVKGAFKGGYNTVLRDFGSASVRTQRADGTIIAESAITSADAEGFNFVLQIPVASQVTPKACVVGESLDCVFLTDEGEFAVANALQVDTPINVGILTINYVDVETYTNSLDGAVVEIPVAYINEAQAYLDESMPGTRYNPWDDYDNDGISNYGEFVSGTHPFDESDYLYVKNLTPEGEQFALSFEHVGGHVYVISAANTLANPAWAKRRVSRTAEGAELDQVLAEGTDGEPGETVIYITPAAGASNEFFRVEAQ